MTKHCTICYIDPVCSHSSSYCSRCKVKQETKRWQQQPAWKRKEKKLKLVYGIDWLTFEQM